MKKNIYYSIVCFFLLNFPIFVYSQEINNDGPIYNGQIEFTNNDQKKDSSVLIAYLEPLSPSRTNWSSIFPKIDAGGNFSFRLPFYSEPALMAIMLKSDKRGYHSFSPNGYYFTSKDRVKIKIIRALKAEDSKIIFKGNGIEKYKIANALDTLSTAIGLGAYRTEWTKLKLEDPNNFLSKLQALEKVTEDFLSRKVRLIENSGLDTEMKKLVSYEYGFITSDWILALLGYSIRHKNNDSIQNMIQDNLTKNLQRFSYSQDSLMAYSPSFLRQLSRIESNLLVMNAGSKKTSLEDLFTVFENKYSGKIREMLIANFFFQPIIDTYGVIKTDKKEVDNLMIHYQNYITLPSLKSRYIKSLRLTAGTALYDGIFRDTADKPVNLSTFKGKVFLIDIWYTGCGACATFHQAFHKESYVSLKDNKDFVYISISVDRKRDTWVKTLESDKYTAPEYMNLYADKSFDHAFLQYYNIQGAPFLLIVDRDGNVYSDVFGDAKGALSLIHEALAKPAKN